jgi:hypothetical protein
MHAAYCTSCILQLRVTFDAAALDDRTATRTLILPLFHFTLRIC